LHHTWSFFDAELPFEDTGSEVDHIVVMQPDGGPAKNVPEHNFHQPDRWSLARFKEILRIPGGKAALARKSHGNNCLPRRRRFKTFKVGQYIFRFGLSMGNELPESICLNGGEVRYYFQAIITREGYCPSSVTAHRDVRVLRVPGPDSTEEIEPIFIRQTRLEKIRYEIYISGRSFELNSSIQISIKTTTSAEMYLQSIQISIREDVVYRTNIYGGLPLWRQCLDIWAVLVPCCERRKSGPTGGFFNYYDRLRENGCNIPLLGLYSAFGLVTMWIL
jgi:hypothetical protein